MGHRADLSAAVIVLAYYVAVFCADDNTGAGGANVWDYESLRVALAGSPQELPVLPDGIGLSFAARIAGYSPKNRPTTAVITMRTTPQMTNPADKASFVMSPSNIPASTLTRQITLKRMAATSPIGGRT